MPGRVIPGMSKKATSGPPTALQKPFKPMLAKAPEDKWPIQFPALAQPKLDGIRCTITPSGPRTRSGELFPNRALDYALSDHRLCGLDGELVAGMRPNAPNVYQATESQVMSEEGGVEGLTFYAFDYIDSFEQPSLPFVARSGIVRFLYESITSSGYYSHILQPLQTHMIHSVKGLEDLTNSYLHDGYEGLIVRDPWAAYKFGRTTAKERILIKLKPFEDTEGEVVAYYPLQHNLNPLERGKLGQAKRSSKKAGKLVAEMLGGVVVKLGPEWNAETVNVGGGWTRQQRIDLWADRQSLPGRLCRYKFQRVGSKNAPRNTIWTGWRDRRDLGG